MRLLNANGVLVKKNVSKYIMDWDCEERSKIQFKAKKFFQEFWENDVCYREFPVYGTKFKIDIFNATRKIAVEVDGKQHGEFNKFFHNNDRNKFLKSIKNDVEKEKWLELNEITIIRINEEEIEDLSKELIKTVSGVEL